MPWLTPPTPFAKPSKLRALGERPEVGVEDLERGDDWLDVDGVSLSDDVLDVTDLSTVQIVGSRLTGVRLVASPGTSITIRDSVLERCDLSTLWSESVLRTEFVGCKMSGSEFVGVVSDSRFTRCSIRMANFSTAKLTRVEFVDSELLEVDFFDANLSHVSFAECAITDLNLDRAVCDRVDFRQAAQIGLKAATDLAGCLVTPVQTQEMALWLAHQLGFSIESN